MADALSSSFDEWIRSLLNDLQSDNVDMSDFVEYFLSIVTSDSETDEEKKMAIAELLGDLDSKHNHSIDKLSQQILDQWYSSQDNHIAKSQVVEHQNDNDVIHTTLINAMNQIESTAKLQKQSNNKFDDDISLRKHKLHILEKYSEVSDEEFDYEDELGVENNLFRNTNIQDVEDRDKKKHEKDIKKQQEKK